MKGGPVVAREVERELETAKIFFVGSAELELGYRVLVLVDAYVASRCDAEADSTRVCYPRLV
jgi:hypothetical protein